MPYFPGLPSKNYDELRKEIRSGDILLCSGTSVFSKLIQSATKSIWSHVAFIIRLDPIDRIMVLESVESIGVRAVSLSSYVNDYNGTSKAYPGQMMLARHHAVLPQNIRNLSKYAVDLLGYPYDKEEIIRISARVGMWALGVKEKQPDPIPQREFICSEYAYVCFKSIGVDIKYNDLGFIAPVDFARSPEITPYSYIATSAHLDAAQKQHLAELSEADF